MAENGRPFNDFGNLLIFLSAEAQCYSAKEFADALGVADETVTGWYGNKQHPQPHHLRQIKKLLIAKRALPTRGDRMALLNRLYAESVPRKKTSGSSDLSTILDRLKAIDQAFSNATDAQIITGPQSALVPEWLGLIQAATDQMRVADDVDAQAHILADLFTLPHWNDGAAVLRKAIYIELGVLALGRLHDRTSQQGLRFLLTFALIAEHNRRDAALQAINALLPYYLDVLQDRAAHYLARERTDQLIADTIATPDDLCGWLDNEKTALSAIGKAGIFRCAACKALRHGRYDETRAAVDRARGFLGTAPDGPDKIAIGYYLTMALIAADWHQRKATSRELIRRAAECADAIHRFDRRDAPMSMGLYAIIMQAVTELPDRQGEASERKDEMTKSAAWRIQALGHGSVPGFCAFDLDAVRRMAAAALER